MNPKVVPIPSKKPQDGKLTDTVPTSVAAIVAQTDRENLQLEGQTHKKNKQLVEKINVLTIPLKNTARQCQARYAEWCGHEQHASHVAFIPKSMLWFLMVLILIGEWMLASTVLRGLQFEDWKTYVMSGGIVGVAFALTKGLSYGLRWLISVHHNTPRERWAQTCMLVAGGLILGIMVYAMGEVRIAYGQAAAQSGVDAGQMSSQVANSLTLLQGILYFGQVVVFWFLLSSNPMADRARQNYEVALKDLLKLHRRRAKLASQLNENVLRMRAKWEENIENARYLIAHYLRELAIARKEGNATPSFSSEIRKDWFAPVPDRLSASVDAEPPEVQALLTDVSQQAAFTDHVQSQAPANPPDAESRMSSVRQFS
jgi:cation transport ATPase